MQHSSASHNQRPGGYPQCPDSLEERKKILQSRGGEDSLEGFTGAACEFPSGAEIQIIGRQARETESAEPNKSGHTAPLRIHLYRVTGSRKDCVG